MKHTPLSALEKQLGYHFHAQCHLQTALKHRSATNEHNERLEFLGDSLLNFAIAACLYKLLPNATEGELTTLRAHLVREEMLADIAVSLSLNEHLILGQGEIKSGGASRASTLADALEAIFAAVFIDGGIDQALRVIQHVYQPMMSQLDTLCRCKKQLEETFKDAKSRLQERLQADKKPLPCYELVAISGKDHEQLFEVACIVGHLSTAAKGTSRKRAEQQAALAMLEKLS